MPFNQNPTSLSNHFRALTARFKNRKYLFLALTLCCVFLLLFISTSADWSLATKLPSGIFRSRPGQKARIRCSPEDYDSGEWVRRPYWSRPGPLNKANPDEPNDPDHETPAPLENMTRKEDALTFSRFQGCASGRDRWLQLGSDIKEKWDRFPQAHNWEWVPGGHCGRTGSAEDGLRVWDAEQMVRDLVEHGGWLLVGDSVTENHFFSLSCLLYPHVIAVPDYSHIRYDRKFPQNLYLNPTSPLLQSDSFTPSNPLRLPSGFNITETPLVTFNRADLLWSQDELLKMHKELHPEIYGEDPEFKLFGNEVTYTMSPNTYLDTFTQPLPQGNYATMVVSTAGHWTVGLFRGYQKVKPGTGGVASKLLFGNQTELMAGSADPVTLAEGEAVLGYDGLLAFFGEAMERWAGKVHARLAASTMPDQSRRQVVLRPYLPGHIECHKQREPFKEIRPLPENEYWNWGAVWKYNRLFERILSSYDDLHYLKINRPARLRPDAHSSHDCLHIFSGAGVLEGWTHYIWHYLTREL